MPFDELRIGFMLVGTVPPRLFKHVYRSHGKSANRRSRLLHIKMRAALLKAAEPYLTETYERNHERIQLPSRGYWTVNDCCYEERKQSTIAYGRARVLVHGTIEKRRRHGYGFYARPVLMSMYSEGDMFEFDHSDPYWNTTGKGGGYPTLVFDLLEKKWIRA